ncbi:monosaccharide ABC transporter ATP-binding protein, CUT2 family [Rhizobiales bacterium GAS113]|nr:monosaccharide ABC transporter ATP-binding protein, CUT2 family [Rhizobiales bacterium GAS113]
MPPFLELTAIGKSFGGVRALEDVDLTLEPGEVHCIVGENGSGKSTLIKIISGVVSPEPGGRIVIEGQDYPALTPVLSTSCGVQVIYQDLSLFPNLTVAENIAVSRHLGALKRVDWRKMREIAAVAVAKIGVKLDLDAKVEDLTIANRQLVAICRAMAADAKLMIMDEPTASLTRHEVDALLGLVRDLKSRGVCIVFVSHRLDEVLEVAERVTVLRDGRKVGTFEASDVDDKKLAHLMTGKEFVYEPPRLDLSCAPVVLSVSGLTRLGDYRDISFEVRAGEVLGITGLLGSGRTELALTLFGMNPSDAGEVRIAGRPVALTSNRQAIEEGIAYVSEDRLTLGLVLDQPIASNLLLTVLDRLVGRLGLLDMAKRRSTVAHWIEELSIKVSDPENPVKTLSGGNQQRVVLAKWMALQPRLLILDSPTVGVDINGKDGIYAVIRGLAEAGVAIIMISDDIPEVLYHSHRVLIMRGGEITGEFDTKQSSEQELRAVVDA